MIASLIYNLGTNLYIYAFFFLVIIACTYVLYDGYKKKQIRFAISEVLIIALVLSSIYLYTSDVSLYARVKDLEKAQLHEVDWTYSWGGFYAEGGRWCSNDTVKGIIFNSGTSSVNVTIVFVVWGQNVTSTGVSDVVVYTKQLPIGQIGGKSYVSFETNLVYFGIGSGSIITHSLLLT
jgi:hypothetical protein